MNSLTKASVAPMLEAHNAQSPDVPVSTKAAFVDASELTKYGVAGTAGVPAPVTAVTVETVETVVFAEKLV